METDKNDTYQHDEKGQINASFTRRTCLKGLATAGLAAAVPGMARRASAQTTAERMRGYFERFDTVVDMGEAGADPSGTEPIDDLLRQYRGDDTLLLFPPGRYLMTEQFRYSGYSNFGLVGNDATIVPGTIEAVEENIVTEGTFSGPARLFRLGVHYNPGERLLFEGFDFDYTAESSGLRAIEAHVTDDLLVRDIDILGKHDTGTFGPALFAITEPDGVGTVDGFRAPDGGEYTENTVGDIWTGPTGINVPPQHYGKIWLRDCELGAFPDNGLYVSGTNGRVCVKGGIYRNSNVASIRLKGDNSFIHDATIIVDDRHPGRNQRGIRLDEGTGLWVYNTTITLTDPNGHAITVKNDVSSARIQNCSITVENRPNDGICIYEDAGQVDIIDTDIGFESAGNAVVVYGRNDATDARVWLLRTTVTGGASGSRNRAAIRCERANCRLQDVTVNQPGPDYRRALELHGDNCSVEGGTYESTHHPIINVANGTTITDTMARSFEGYQGVKLYPDFTDVTVTDSTLYNGILDKGMSVGTLLQHDNEFPTA